MAKAIAVARRAGKLARPFRVLDYMDALRGRLARQEGIALLSRRMPRPEAARRVMQNTKALKQHR